METILYISCVLLLLASMSYAILIFLFTKGWMSLERMAFHGGIATPSARVTVVVAARNEERQVLSLLRDLEQQDYPPGSLEVIVVDDNSSDRTASVVSGFINRAGREHFKLISRNEGQGSKKQAIALAVSMASGDLILTTDADCRLTEGWVSAMACHFSDRRIMMVAGPVAYTGLKNATDRFQALEFLGLVASGAGAIGAGHPFMCNGACLAYRKEAFARVSGYSGNEWYTSGDDVFLLHKIKKAFGRKSIAFAPGREALVRTLPAKDLVAFFRQRARWASKSRGYRDFLSLLTAVTVFLLSVSMAGLLIAGFFHPVAFLLFLGMLLSKTLVDYPLLSRIAQFTGNKGLLKWILPFQAVYPFYVVTAGLMSAFRRQKW